MKYADHQITRARFKQKFLEKKEEPQFSVQLSNSFFQITAGIFVLVLFYGFKKFASFPLTFIVFDVVPGQQLEHN
jgi:hypothetical protein